jgi:hypothetical protein
VVPPPVPAEGAPAKLAAEAGLAWVEGTQVVAPLQPRGKARPPVTVQNRRKRFFFFMNF